MKLKDSFVGFPAYRDCLITIDIDKRLRMDAHFEIRRMAIAVTIKMSLRSRYFVIPDKNRYNTISIKSVGLTASRE